MGQKSKFHDILPENQKDILAFAEESRANGLSQNTVNNYTCLLTMFAYELKKSFRQVTREDVKRFFDNTDLLPSSQETIKVILKMFYRQIYNLERGEKLPDCIRNINKT